MRDIFDCNIRLQKLCHEIVTLVHHQNFYMVRAKISSMKIEFSTYLELGMTFGISDELQQEYMLVLSEIVDAIENTDYVLLADLIEMKLLPSLLLMQEEWRETDSVGFWDAIWDENLAELDKKMPQLSRLLRDEKAKWLREDYSKFWIEPTNSGLQTLAATDEKGVYYYHSNSNPEREAMAFVDWYSNVNTKRYILFGFGLGYHARALSDAHDGAEVHIYESNLRVLMFAMMANSLSWLWDNPTIRLIYDPDFRELSADLEGIDSVGECDKQFVVHYPSLRHILQANIKEGFEQFFIRDSGIRNQSPQMTINFKHNLQNCEQNVDALEPEFAGKHAIIVAAGPSLDKNVHQLLNKKDDMIIISTGTVFHKLLELGVDVDYVIVADAKKNTAVQFDKTWDATVPLIVLSTAYYAFAQRYKGKKYIILQNEYKDAEKAAVEQKHRLYATGGSVSTTALDLCIRMGCKDICFLGLDLAYTDGYSHAEGSAGSRTRDMSDLTEIKGYEYIVTGNTKQYIEKKVYSNRLFGMYRKWIESRVKEQDCKLRIYDASEGGSIISGLEIIPFADYVEKLQ